MRVGELAREALQTGFRLVPWPTEPGLRVSGTPEPSSPVLVTANYDLTVRRLLRALRGVDAWVVVAPARGINVWCAAAGGHFTTHQVVTALKTSGIEERVRHRRAILPQLAATGVEGREVSRRCGWKVRFGPVHAGDIPAYLAGRERKTDAMRRVRFGLGERLEMAAAWATPAALVVGGGAALLRPAWALPLAALAIALSVAVFLVLDRIPGPRRALAAGGAALAAFAAAAAWGAGPAALAAAPVAAATLIGVLTFDFAGSTPVEGGSHLQSRGLRIRLDEERCIGAYSCWGVCPEACFEKREDVRKIELAHDERCVRCGACVVQCPQDALAFEDADGRAIPPALTRRYKLNLLGQQIESA